MLLCLIHQVQETYICAWPRLEARQGREEAYFDSLCTPTSRFGIFISGEESRQREGKDRFLLAGIEPRIVQLVTKSLHRLRYPPPYDFYISNIIIIIIIIICLLSDLSTGPNSSLVLQWLVFKSCLQLRPLLIILRIMTKVVVGKKIMPTSRAGW
jgi:hypothetical protein